MRVNRHNISIFFFNDTATTEIYTLSLHDALPIYRKRVQKAVYIGQLTGVDLGYRFSWYVKGPYSTALTRDYYDLAEDVNSGEDRKSTRLNSSHANISYAVFCLKKKTTFP